MADAALSPNVPVIPEVTIDSAESMRRSAAKLFLEDLKRSVRPSRGHDVCEVIPGAFYWRKHPSENEWLRGIAKRFEDCGHTTRYENRVTYWETYDGDKLPVGEIKWHMCVSWGSTGANDTINI